MNAVPDPSAADSTPESSRLTPKAPRTLWLAVVGLAIEAAEMLGFAIVVLVLEAAQPSGAFGSAVALAAMFVVLAAGLVGLAFGTVRARRWARPASVAWQILLVLSALTGVWGNGWVIAGIVVPAVITLLGTFLPPSVRFYDGALKAADAAHQAEVADRDAAWDRSREHQGPDATGSDGDVDEAGDEAGEAATGLSAKFAAARRARSKGNRPDSDA